MTIQDIFSATSKTRIQSLKSELRGIKKSGTIEEYLSKIRTVAESLAALDHPLSNDNHIQAYDDMLVRSKNLGRMVLVANLTQAESFNYFTSRGGGRRERGGGRFQRGGRNLWQNNQTFCQICGRGGHAAYNCY
ncbi:hypothetical protein PIB30_055650 [Stylosanthes scabra]|uniref:CCHC-type domain-containing protein n=1 Tax=Stylosanthes scabra TaxID=79078 RepID=A0ABU6VHM5_9FABA|nr:hypothetical protein [Stylosanthes scabra]